MTRKVTRGRVEVRIEAAEAFRILSLTSIVVLSPVEFALTTSLTLLVSSMSCFPLVFSGPFVVDATGTELIMSINFLFWSEPVGPEELEEGMTTSLMEGLEVRVEVDAGVVLVASKLCNLSIRPEVSLRSTSRDAEKEAICKKSKDTQRMYMVGEQRGDNE